MLVALAGGVGAARFLRGLVRVVPPEDLVVVVNTGDDEHFHGLHVAPDLDSVTYTLAGIANPETGWGLAGETFHCLDALDRLGAPTWFRLGDADLATHLFRTERLRGGSTLSEATAAITASLGLEVTLLPMSDDRVATVIEVEPAPDELPMQEWFVRHRAEPRVRGVRFDDASAARPAPGVLEAIRGAERILVCPSNPVISIGPILAVPGIRDALVARRADVTGVSPIIAGAPVKGPADRLMGPLAIDVSCVGVARTYADFCGTLVIDTVDAASAPAIEDLGVRAVVADTLMTDLDAAAQLARTAIDGLAAA